MVKGDEGKECGLSVALGFDQPGLRYAGEDVGNDLLLKGLQNGRIKCMDSGGRIQVYAADDRTADGVIPTLALIDELHRHRDLRLYRTWRGKLDKRGGQIVTISTAGEPNSEFEDTRARILEESETEERGAHLRGVGEDIIIHDYAVRDPNLVDDMDVVAEANPRAAITPEVLGRKFRSSTMTIEHWKRFVCNIATRMTGQAISYEDWDALAEPGLEPKEAWCVGWLDLGWKIDTTAVGLLTWESSDRRVISDVVVLEPPVYEGDIVEAMVDIQNRRKPVGWVFDPNAGGIQMAQQLDRGEHPRQGSTEFEFIEHSQDNSPMALAARRFDAAIRNGWLRHNGDPTLRKHVTNAVRKELGAEQWKYDRPPDAKGEKRKRFPIDALTGAEMGHSVAVAEHDEAKNSTVTFA